MVSGGAFLRAGGGGWLGEVGGWVGGWVAVYALGGGGWSWGIVFFDWVGDRGGGLAGSL